ncbi:MAG: calcium/sodium antiporter [Candidatus Woesearchaeota archaeon]
MFLVNFAFFTISCIILVKSSSFLVKSLLKISQYLNLNEFTVGFIIMAVSTSLPELFIGITSAINKTPELTVGNVIGSNILDLTLIVGIVAILAKGIKITSKIIKRDVFYMLAILVVPLLLALDRTLSRIDGIILVLIFVLYIWQMIKQERRFHKTMNTVNKQEALSFLFIAFVSIIILLVSSKFVVEFATSLSVDLGIPHILIGLFIISVGTCLPELITGTKAVLARHDELAMGDLLGSVITNSTLVLGTAAIIYPLSIDIVIFFSSGIFMVLMAFIFMTFAESEKGISWKEGMSLILLYLFFVIIESYLKILKG